MSLLKSTLKNSMAANFFNLNKAPYKVLLREKEKETILESNMSKMTNMKLVSIRIKKKDVLTNFLPINLKNIFFKKYIFDNDLLSEFYYVLELYSANNTPLPENCSLIFFESLNLKCKVDFLFQIRNKLTNQLKGKGIKIVHI